MSTDSIQQLIQAEAKKLAANMTSDLPTYAAKGCGGLDYVIVRAYSSGVYAGYLQSISGNTIKLVNSRYCREFATAGPIGDVHDLATVGVNPGKKQGIRPAVPQRTLVDHFEVVHATEQARASIEALP